MVISTAYVHSNEHKSETIVTETHIQQAWFKNQQQSLLLHFQMNSKDRRKNKLQLKKFKPVSFLTVDDFLPDFSVAALPLPDTENLPSFCAAKNWTVHKFTAKFTLTLRLAWIEIGKQTNAGKWRNPSE
jgi:hypothetical protein